MAELIPESYVACLAPDVIFGRQAPLNVDLGCGDGSLLAILANEKPKHNFLGVERLAGRVRTASRKTHHLANVRILRVETAYAVRYLLPPNSVDAFYLLFPDPWPKRKHQRRRLVTPEFLDSIAGALRPSGRFCVATDQHDYFDEIVRLVQESRKLEARDDEQDPLPATTFEKRFTRAGVPIYRLELRKVSPVI